MAEALDGLPTAVTVCDPAAGGGAFLLAAARALAARGVPRRTIVEELLFGIDIDPLAVAVCEAALVLWSLEQGDDPGLPGGHLACGDALTLGWTGFDAVVGNPPFLNQLGRATARATPDRARLRHRFGDAAAGYADTATVFLVAACSMVRPGGRVALVQPESLLSARDAGPARGAIARAGALRALWHSRQPVFAAGVRVCAPVIEVGGTAGPVRRFDGPHFTPGSPVDADPAALRTWAPLIARSAGVPDTPLRTSGTLGDECNATADFRDQYYGLVPFVSDDGAGVPLITSGLIDPGVSRWGTVPTRFAKRQWQHPRVDVAALRAASPAMGRWVDARLVPKILVATQTRVIEAVVDEDGQWLPCTPVITVTGERPWHAAAVLLAPPVSAWALRTFGGAALSADAIKLSASQVLAAPTPADRAAWDEAAARLRGGAPPEAVAATMCDAYGCPAEMWEWWRTRLPRRTFSSAAP